MNGIKLYPDDRADDIYELCKKASDYLDVTDSKTDNTISIVTKGYLSFESALHNIKYYLPQENLFKNVTDKALIGVLKSNYTLLKLHNLYKYQVRKYKEELGHKKAEDIVENPFSKAVACDDSWIDDVIGF